MFLLLFLTIKTLRINCFKSNFFLNFDSHLQKVIEFKFDITRNDKTVRYAKLILFYFVFFSIVKVVTIVDLYVQAIISSKIR